MKRVLWILIAASACAQNDGEYRVKTTSELVLLDVSVENSRGQRVADLPQESFRIYENRKLQPVTYFSADDLPATIGLVVDQSGSMLDKRTEVLEAAKVFVRASNPMDQMFVVNFNDRVAFGLPPGTLFSSRVNLLENAISSALPQGRTALNDAVMTALKRADEGPNRRKALLLLTDGGDNASDHSERELMDAIEKSQTTVYTLGLFSPNDSESNPGLLQRLARISGGETYLSISSSELPKLLDHIAHEIRSRYSIAYVPARKNGSGGVRTIRVEASEPKGGRLVVRTRTRYKLPELE
jgi:Ca-activated chloride channel homolog